MYIISIFLISKIIIRFNKKINQMYSNLFKLFTIKPNILIQNLKFKQNKKISLPSLSLSHVGVIGSSTTFGDGPVDILVYHFNGTRFTM